MKKSFQKSAVIATGFLSLVLLFPAAHSGIADGSNPIGGIIPTPKFRTSVDIEEGYNDNVDTTQTSKIASAFTTGDINIFADLGNKETVLTIGVGGGLTYYYSNPGAKTDKLANLTVNFIHKVNERLSLSFNSYNTYQVQPQFDLLVAQNRVNGQYLYSTESIAANYQWSKRFSTITSYIYTGIFYQDKASRTTNDYVQQTFSNQFRYLALPTTTLVAEYRFGLVNYLYEPQQNSVTNYGLLGFDHSFSPEASMTLRGGAALQDQKSGKSTDSPYGEITGIYQYQRYSTLQMYMNYGFQYANLATSQSDRALRTGITINHGLTPKLIAVLGLFYEHDDYSQSGSSPGTAFTEDTVNVNTGLHFALTPKLMLQISYQHTQLLSNVQPDEYEQNVVTLGANYTF